MTTAQSNVGMDIIFPWAHQKIRWPTDWKRDMVAPSHLHEYFKGKDYAHAKGGTKHQIAMSTSKDKITHELRVGHGRSTVRFRCVAQKTRSRTSRERNVGVATRWVPQKMKWHNFWERDMVVSTSNVSRQKHILSEREHGRSNIRFRWVPQNTISRTLWERDMVVATSDFDEHFKNEITYSWEWDMGMTTLDFHENIERQDNQQVESGTWSWQHQISMNASKDEITHFLRGTWSWRHQMLRSTHELRVGHVRRNIRFRWGPQKARSRTSWDWGTVLATSIVKFA